MLEDDLSPTILFQQIRDRHKVEGNGDGGPLSNYREVTEGKTTFRVGLPLGQIRDKVLARTSGWPKRVGERLFALDAEDQPQWLDNAHELFAWLRSRFDSCTGSGVRWKTQEDCATKLELDAHLRQNVEAFDSVERFPHWPPVPRCYYLHRALPSGNSPALRELLARFQPATAADADLIHALFLTLIWGGAAGQRPAFLIDAEEDDLQRGRGVGKSKLKQAAAHLVGGHIDARPDENFDKLITRLLSPAALDRRVVSLDNVKRLRFSWAELEALITADVVSGHTLYVGEGRRPNYLVWIITANGAALSRDMAQRCVPIRLKRPPHDPNWEMETWKLIEDRRDAIIADLITELQRPANPLRRYSRWSVWEHAILSRVGDPDAAQRVIEERQATIDDDQAEADLVRQAFVAELERRGHWPNQEAVWISSAKAAEVVNAATGERYPIRRASSYLATLAIPELRKSDYKGNRGWAWRGEQTKPDERLVDLGEVVEKAFT